MKKQKNMFSGRAVRSMAKANTNYGYLKLPEDINVFKAEGGTEVIFDIIPYIVNDKNHIDNKKNEDDAVVGELWWKRPIKVHRNVGPDTMTVVCPTTFGNKCPICEHGAQRKKDGAEWTGELEFIFPKHRSLFLVAPVDATDCEIDYTEGEIHVLEMADHNFLNILLEDVKKDIDNEDFANPWYGKSIEVYFRNEKFGKNKYAKAAKFDFVKRKEQYDDLYEAEAIGLLPCLDDMLKVLSYNELDAMYFGMGDMEKDIDNAELEDDPDEEPTRRKPRERKPRERKPRERSPETEEEPTEEAPVRKPRGRKADPEPEEEPTEEAPPRTRKPRTRKADPEPEPEAEEETPARKPRERKKKTECPFDHEFGKDNDSFDDCDKCKVWDACADAKDQLESDR